MVDVRDLQDTAERDGKELLEDCHEVGPDGARNLLQRRNVVGLLPTRLKAFELHHDTGHAGKHSI